MSNAHPSTGLQNSNKYHINYIYSTINNNLNSVKLGPKLSLVYAHKLRIIITDFHA